MKNTIAGIYGAVTGLLVAIAHDQLFKDILKWPESASLTAATAIGMFLLVVYELVTTSKAVAKLLSPISKVEGAWRITLTNNEDRPMSVCKIYFTQRDHVYSGYGINSDGTIGSTWSSRDVHYDEEQDELMFTADASLTKNGRRVHNYGYIKFHKNADGNFEYGNGYFVDMADELTQTHMTLVKIQDDEFDKFVKDAFAKTKAVGGHIA